jgi:hypothetical protein
MLNILWLGLLLVAVFLGGFTGRMEAVTSGAFSAARDALMVVALPLAGLMGLWLGFLRLAELSGIVEGLARLLHRGHEQADQSAHDRDHDQQFNQRESTQWLSFGPDGWRNKTPKVPLGILLAEVVAAKTPNHSGRIEERKDSPANGTSATISGLMSSP